MPAEPVKAEQNIALKQLVHSAWLIAQGCDGHLCLFPKGFSECSLTSFTIRFYIFHSGSLTGGQP